MPLADFLVDLAAVASASRSVAARHVALRAQQLERFGRASSIAAVVKARKASKRPDSGQTESATAGESAVTSDGSPGRPVQQEEQRDLRDSLRYLRTSQGIRANAENLRASINDVQSILRQLEVESEATTVGNPQASSLPDEPGAPATRPPGRAVDQACKDDSPLDANVDDELPPGVDFNIFHTSRGSSILEKNGIKPSRSPTVPNLTTPSALSSKVPLFVDHGHDKPKQSDRGTVATEASSPPPAGTDTAVLEAPTAESAALEHEPSAPAHAEAVAPKPDTSAPKPYILRESTVPATRLSRLWNYGGLAAGMLGGAVTESISRVVGGGSSAGSNSSVLLSGRNMERLVAKLSRMRGAALKLGQMMSFQDSKMLPAPIQEVLQRVQDRADYMPAWQRDRVLATNLGTDWRALFSEFDETPVAAASIGQVHRATLRDGNRRVAVKIQFPGVADSINSDLDNLGILLAATRLLPKGLYLDRTIANARTELGWECDYAREAACATRFRELLADETDTFVVPAVHASASGPQVLTMDFMDGVGVTRAAATLTQEQRDWIGTQVLRLCLREIAEFRFMQTDPNWTNFLWNAQTQKLELLDFGAAREFPDEFVSLYLDLLSAASRGDRNGVKDLSERLGYLTGHESRAMLDAHVDSVVTLAEPFLASAPEVYDFAGQTITERVKALIPVMLRERLAPPPEETYSLHRKLSGAFLLCARLGSRVPCRDLFQQALTRRYVLKAAEAGAAAPSEKVSV